MKCIIKLLAFGIALTTPAVAQGLDWTQVTPANSPSARSQHAMTYDSVRGKVVMFGGTDGIFNQVNDTWEYDGANWTQITTTLSPSGRAWQKQPAD